jgi:hypothetical protein
LEHAKAYDSLKVNGGRKEDNPIIKIGIKWRSFLFDLSY